VSGAPAIHLCPAPARRSTMKLTIRKTAEDILYALVKRANKQQEELAVVDGKYHACVTSLVTTGSRKDPTAAADLMATASATDLATAVAKANLMQPILNRHFADTKAHDTAVSAANATALATDEATLVTLCTAYKAAYNTHLSAASVHFTNDSTNTTAATATDMATSCTLLNELDDDFNAHVANAASGAYIDLVDC
jgi:hypothetical protein